MRDWLKPTPDMVNEGLSRPPCAEPTLFLWRSALQSLSAQMVNRFLTRKTVKICKPKDVWPNIGKTTTIDHLNE
jgi:hypothetical protein